MSALTELLKTYKKKDSPVIGPVSRMLALQPAWTNRTKGVIHPSELVYSDRCERAICLRILTGRVFEDTPTLVRESIFDEGHEYHRKWQAWMWDVGRLYGLYECLRCDHKWKTVSPKECSLCQSGRKYLVYREVPVIDTDLNIHGHGDGAILPDGTDEWDPSVGTFVEIKSVGDGTIRIDDLGLLVKHTHDMDGTKVINYAALWRDLRSPLMSHIKQVNIYAAILKVPTIVIIYEYKMGGQQPKEFVLKANPSLVQDELDLAHYINEAVKKKEPLPCPRGGCAKCEAYDAQGDEDGKRSDGAGRGGSGGDVPAGQAEDGDTEPATGRDGGERPGTDEGVPGVRRVAGLRGDDPGDVRERSDRRRALLGEGESPAPRYRRRRNRDGGQGPGDAAS